MIPKQVYMKILIHFNLNFYIDITTGSYNI